MADHQRLAGRSREADQFIRLLGARRQRLFNKHVFARFKCLFRERVMRRGGCRDNHGIHRIAQQRVLFGTTSERGKFART